MEPNTPPIQPDSFHDDVPVDHITWEKRVKSAGTALVYLAMFKILWNAKVFHKIPAWIAFTVFAVTFFFFPSIIGIKDRILAITLGIGTVLSYIVYSVAEANDRVQRSNKPKQQ